MDNTYKSTSSAVYLINYHFVFCPRYRRKIFLIPDVEDRFRKLVADICNELGIEVIAMECDEDHTHLFLNCRPDIRPSDIMFRIKGFTAKKLREEFSELSKMKSLWTRSFFCSTDENISSEIVREYVEKQKKRYY